MTGKALWMIPFIILPNDHIIRAQIQRGFQAKNQLAFKLLSFTMEMFNGLIADVNASAWI